MYIPSMAAVHICTIANARRRAREKEAAERAKKKNNICKKDIPCKYCFDEYGCHLKKE